MFSTLSLYFGSLFSVSVLNVLDNKLKLNGIFIFFSFLLLLLLSALRLDIGTDYLSYKYIFDTIKINNSFEIEIGFLFLNKLVQFFDLPFEAFIFLCSFLTLFFIYKAFPKKYMFLLVFLYIASNSYFQSFSMIRQSLAIAIAANAMVYVYKNDFLKYSLWILCATSIHLSMILFLPLYFLRKLTINKLYVVMILFWYFIVNNTGFMEYILNNIVANTPYAAYVANSFAFKEVNIGSGLGVLFRILIGVIVIVNSESILKKYPHVNYYLLLLVVYELSYIAALKVFIFNRLADVFSIYFFYSIPFFIYSINKKFRIVVLFISILLFLILMTKNLTNDYFQTSGGINVVPYKSLI